MFLFISLHAPLYYSYLHAMKDNSMLHAADCAQDIEKATEASLSLIFQLVALSSGVLEDDDYLVNFTTISGTKITFIRQRK